MKLLVFRGRCTTKVAENVSPCHAESVRGPSPWHTLRILSRQIWRLKLEGLQHRHSVDVVNSYRQLWLYLGQPRLLPLVPMATTDLIASSLACLHGCTG
uniref:Uncharacterized protein n=1 Tax=Sphaerodactylus townsendi TaxID=933632 RepID=A0ACB8EWK0_9SAUR